MSGIVRWKLSQRMFIIAAFTGSVMAISFGFFATSAEAQTASSYQSSCQNIKVAGATLTASCRRKDGAFNDTSILIRGILNDDGVLKFSSIDDPSSYQSSCQNLNVVGATLTASCRRKDGAFNNTSILIPGIWNNDGNLSY